MTDITSQNAAPDIRSPLGAIAEEPAAQAALARLAALGRVAAERGKLGIATLTGLPEVFPGTTYE